MDLCGMPKHVRAHQPASHALLAIETTSRTTRTMYRTMLVVTSSADVISAVKLSLSQSTRITEAVVTTMRRALVLLVLVTLSILDNSSMQ